MPTRSSKSHTLQQSILLASQYSPTASFFPWCSFPSPKVRPSIQDPLFCFRKGSVFVFVFVSLDLEKMNKKPGDWNCRSCQHLNFSRRDSCQRCGDPRTGDRGDFGSFGSGRGGTSFGFSGSDVRPGDWYCSAGNCGTHNFASRSSCFKCGAFKDESGGSFDGDSRSRGGAFGFSGRSSWKSGDWICTRSGCNEHNFASRTECFRCNAPRDYGN